MTKVRQDSYVFTEMTGNQVHGKYVSSGWARVPDREQGN